MVESITFSSRPEVETALADPALVPPPKPATLQAGPTADLRDAMARFSSGESHAARRAAVLQAIGELDVGAIEDLAAERTSARLTGPRMDAADDVAYVVPTECLGHLLGAQAGDVDQLRDDVCSVVEVIGRGQPSSAVTDEATTRLLERFGSSPSGAVSMVSLLYQNHDATAALVSRSVLAHASGEVRASAVTRTVRVASSDTAVNATAVGAGMSVTLDLAAADLEFGAGSHKCPGRALAEAIAAGVLAALVDSSYELMVDHVVLDDDGRPTTLPMQLG